MVIARSPSYRLDRTRAVERVIARHAARGIEGGRVPVGTLRYATLTNYEAGRAGVVVDGDAEVLGRIALDRAEDIPSWEAVRLLANRLFEHLKHRAGSIAAEDAVRKSYEAIGEAQLVLEGRYRPSFRDRATEIRRLPLDSPVAGASERYLEAADSRRTGAEIAGPEVGRRPRRPPLRARARDAQAQRQAGGPRPPARRDGAGRAPPLPPRLLGGPRPARRQGRPARANPGPDRQTVAGRGRVAPRQRLPRSSARSSSGCGVRCPQILRTTRNER